MTITSLQNPRVKAAVRLRRRSQRQEHGLILIDGTRELGRALDAGVRVTELFVCPALCRPEVRGGLRDRVRQQDGAVWEVAAGVFGKLAFGDRSEGTLAVARTPVASLDGLLVPKHKNKQQNKNPLVAVLEAVEKPGNLGAIVRTADAAGVSAVVVAEGGTDLYNPNAIRASLGTIFTLPVCAAGCEEVRGWLGRKGLHIFAARVDAACRYTDVDFMQPAAIVLGAEAAGLSPAWSGDDVTPVTLPMLGAADSLNVSAAAAVLFYEALRQRTG